MAQAMSWSIVTLPIETESDVVAVRQRARRIAELLAFQRQDQTRIATAVSEIARNAFVYAKGGRAEFTIEAREQPQLFRIRISDKGEGIPNLQTILDGQYRSQSGMGLDGGDGLRQARDQRPDVIVLDLQMPNIDGFTVLQELNADQRTSIIPVIVSTSLAVSADLKARLPAGTRLISKNLISRENVSLFLRNAVDGQNLP
jgi:anti-sigma regulatory factor (Ser/Thr protein kinase)